MRECPNCHTPVLDTDKFCKNCGTPLDAPQAGQTVTAEVPAAVQTASEEMSAADQTAQAEVPAAQETKPVKKSRVKIIAAAVVIALAAVIGVLIATQRSGGSGKSGGSKKVIEIAPEEAEAALAKIYDSREFDESKDLSQHPGLLSADQVTGPFLEIRKSDGSYYVPDVIGSDAGSEKELPKDAEIVPAKEDSFPQEYRQLLQTGKNVKKAAKGKEPVVYALMEYTGYGTAGNYNNGGFKLYYHNSRVSFYDLEKGEMLGWMTTSESRHGPFILYTNDYESDGQHPILKFKGGSIWSDTAWTRGLDELFYDENGYQVVGDRLLSVPDDAGTIEVPEGVKTIENNVGSGHTATELILPKGVERIGSAAFSGSAIKEIAFPKSLVYCDTSVFSETPWLNAKKDEKWVIVGDGVLLRCNDTTASELTVPDDVQYIMPGAFAETSCRKITIPKSVRQCCGSIDNEGSAVIANKDSLEELVLEGGLEEEIEDVPIKVVNYCNNLKKIIVDCKTGELPDDWISLNQDTYKSMKMICQDGSAAAKWADDHSVSHAER